MTRAFHWQLLAVVAVVAATFAACGGGPAQPSPSPATTPAPAVTSTSTATTPSTAPSPRATATATPSPSPTPTPATATPSPTPVAPEATTFRYDTYDTTGAVSTPGSYAFLSDPDDTSTVVTTYEALRDGTTTALLIHTSDADGASRADVYDAVEAGDLFEWHEADDCFVRYTVTEVKPDPTGTVPRKLLAVEWMTYAFTGCSGAVSENLATGIDFGPLPDLGGTDLISPVRHGIFQVVPEDWTGAIDPGETHELPEGAPPYPGPYAETRDVTVARGFPYWREPQLPTGWRFSYAFTGGLNVSHGYCAFYEDVDGWAAVEICGEALLGPGTWRMSSAGPNTDGTREYLYVREARWFSGRPAAVRYSPEGPLHHRSLSVRVWVHDVATQSIYTVVGVHRTLLGSNVEDVIAIAESLFTPAPPPEATTFRYDTYDTTGAVSTPGSYAFLSDPDDTSTVVTTYEALRDGTTTALLIHTSDAGGASRADVYDAVEAGDLFEWRQADDCFVRYTVTEVKPDPTGTVPRKLLAVEWMTYAFTGCSGTISGDLAVTMDFGPLPDLGGTSLSAPVVHGGYQIAPAGWTGEVVPWGGDYSPTYPELTSTTDVAEARKMRHWREPALPAGWTFRAAAEGGYEIQPRDGYSALYVTADGEDGFELRGAYVGAVVSGAKEAAWHSGASLRETRVVAGRPAVVIYSRASRGFPLTLWVYDPATQVQYTIYGYHSSFQGGNVDAVIAIAESLFTPAPPATSATTFRYDTYDTTGAVSTAGSYAFLSDPEDTSTAVTTYEALRDGTTTALLIHTSDADGASRADVYDAVEAGDLFEWRQADECFVRYTVTEVKPDPTGTVPRKLLGVEWMTYAYSGCSGAVSMDAALSMAWGEMDDLGGEGLVVPVIHGNYQLVPKDWDGDLAESELVLPDHEPDPQYVTTLAEARELEFWREPTIPEGWVLYHAYADDVWTGPYYGYTAIYLTEVREYPDGVTTREPAFEISGYFALQRKAPWDAIWHNGGHVRETRVIAGRPAVIIYSPSGPNHDWVSHIHIHIYDPATQTEYHFIGDDVSLRGAHVDGAIAIVRSLFESPNAP